MAADQKISVEKFLNTLTDINCSSDELQLVIFDWIFDYSELEVTRDGISSYFSNKESELQGNPDDEGFYADICDKLSIVKTISETIQSRNNVPEITEKAKAFSIILDKIISEVENFRLEKQKRTAETEGKQDDSDVDWKTIAESYEKKIAELKDKIFATEKKLEEINNKFDSKTFSILMNTVSILAIFVAIAFAGFGSFSLISTISLNPTDPILMNMLYLFLIGFFVYNLILIFVYFIFAIIGRDNVHIKSIFIGTSENKKINFFEILDIILLVCVVVLCVLLKFNITI